MLLDFLPFIFVFPPQYLRPGNYRPYQGNTITLAQSGGPCIMQKYVKNRGNSGSTNKADTYGIGKQKTTHVSPFLVLKPTQGSGFFRSVHRQRQKRVFRTHHLPAATSPRLTGHGS